MAEKDRAAAGRRCYTRYKRQIEPMEATAKSNLLEQVLTQPVLTVRRLNGLLDQACDSESRALAWDSCKWD